MGPNGTILGTDLGKKKKFGYFGPKNDKISKLGLNCSGIQPMGSKEKEETTNFGQGTPMGIHQQHLGSKEGRHIKKIKKTIL